MSGGNRIGDVFPSLIGTFANGEAEEFLGLEIDWSLPAAGDLVHVIRWAFNKFARKDLTQISDWAASLYQDIVNAKKSFPGARPALDVMQLDLSVSVMMTATGRKQFHTLRRWIIFAVSDGGYDEGEIIFDMGRLATSVTLPSIGRSAAEAVLLWLRLSYY